MLDRGVAFRIECASFAKVQAERRISALAQHVAGEVFARGSSNRGRDIKCGKGDSGP